MSVEKKISETARFKQSVDEVWELCGDPARISEWLPAVEKSWMENEVRHAELAGGVGQARERIKDHNDAERYYDYDYIDGPLPLDSFSSRLAVVPWESGAEIHWTAQFIAATEAEGAELAAAVSGMYQGGLDGLKNAFGVNSR